LKKYPLSFIVLGFPLIETFFGVALSISAPMISGGGRQGSLIFGYYLRMALHGVFYLILAAVYCIFRIKFEIVPGILISYLVHIPFSMIAICVMFLCLTYSGITEWLHFSDPFPPFFLLLLYEGWVDNPSAHEIICGINGAIFPLIGCCLMLRRENLRERVKKEFALWRDRKRYIVLIILTGILSWFLNDYYLSHPVSMSQMG